MEEKDYLVIQVEVSLLDAPKQFYPQFYPLLGRMASEEQAKDYLETLGLRPRHGSGVLEWWDDPATKHRIFRQRIPRESISGKHS